MSLYYEKSKNKYIIYRHFEEKSIPLFGWIHNCFLCYSLTSRNQKYLNSNKYSVIICKCCKNKFNNKPFAVIKNFIIKNKIY